MPADAAWALCDQCTANGRGSETPDLDKSLAQPPSFTSDFSSLNCDTDQKSFDDEFFTHVAAAGHFVTGDASPEEIPFEVETRPIKIPGYTLLGELGRGGFGAVFEAVQSSTKRKVAIKILLGETLIDRIRFEREAQALGKLNDPRVINVYEAGVSEFGPYFCMERMTGGSLAERLKREGPLEPRMAAQLVESIARGMATVHAANLLHRDLKPGNILMDADGNPKIADFGLAKSYHAEGEESTVAKITQTGGILGTPAFMAPEQAGRADTKVDERTDIYSIGAILYQCLTGQVPFTKKNSLRVLEQVLHDRPADPSSVRHGVPRVLGAISLKCLEKDPKDRYLSSLSLAEDLAAWLRGDETIAKPASSLQRVGAWMQRQRKTATIATLVLAAAATINMAGMWLKSKPVTPPVDDPEAELKKIVAEIATGEEVTLIPEKGLPRYYPKKNNQVIFQGSGFSDGVCTINAMTWTLFELLREEDLPEEFCLRADVRHEYAAVAASRCGLFIGKYEHQYSPTLRLRYFQRLTYSDLLSLFTKVDQNYAMYGPCCAQLTTGKLSDVGIVNSAKYKISTPPVPGPSIWRHLEITVTNQDFILATVTEAPKPPETKRFEKSMILEQLQSSNGLQNPDPQLDAIARAGKLFRGSIGLHVTEGIGNFKNVTIQKISSK